MTQQRVLVVDDDVAVLKTIQRGLKGSGYLVDVASGGPQGLERLKSQTFDSVLVDLGMPEVDGFAVMKHAIREGRCRSVVVITGESSIAVAVEAMRAGAADFLTKPIDMDKLKQAIRRSLGSTPDAALHAAERCAWRDKYAPHFIGQDPSMLEIFGIVERIATTECNVLVSGPSGTGKELVARAVHDASKRAEHVFVAVNCAAIPKELMESEIFGHAKGAFTGAGEARRGKFEVADGGTLFLDEVGEMDISLQSKFLRVIQEKEYTPVGETITKKADVRIVSATNCDLLSLASEKKFREDLYYRLNVVPVQIPSLCDRPADIPLLVDHFIKRAGQRHGRKIPGADEDSMRILSHYSWPGNVRELENLIERVVILKQEEDRVTRADLPSMMVERGDSGALFSELKLPEEGLNIKDALEDLETRLTIDALRRSSGNKARAAELLGLKRTTLIERLKRLNLESF